MDFAGGEVSVTNLKAVDLFCGAGGGSIGLERINVDVVGAVDNYAHAVETYEKAPETNVRPWNKDLTEVNFSDIADHFEFDVDEIDIVMGCPPCQNFSSLRDTDPWPPGESKDELLQTFVRHVSQADPNIVIFENVPGLVTTEGGQYSRWLKHRMNPRSRRELLGEPKADMSSEEIPQLNYGMAFDVVNSADYGVPQKRQRTIGLFVKDAADDEVKIPKPTHIPDGKNSSLLPWKSVEKTIGDLPDLKRGEKSEQDEAHRARRHQDDTMEIIRTIPEGGDRRDIAGTDLELDCHEKMDSETSAGNIYGRMWRNEPAPTLTTRCTSPSSGRFLHYEQNRAITFREAARLMTIPDDVFLPEYNSHAERVIGNAVPPILVQNLVGRFLIHQRRLGNLR